MVFEGLDHRPPARRGPRVLPFDELAIVEFLEDVVPRGLGPQAESFHLLDEGSFAVSRGRLRSILADRDVPDAVERLSGDQHRQVRFADGPVRIVFPPPGILDTVSLGVERLAAEIDLRFRGLRERVRGDRREEPPDHEFVDRPVVVPFHLVATDPLDGIDRRMVRRLHPPSARRDPFLRREGARLCRER